MKLGLMTGYSGSTLRIPLDTIKHVEKLGFDSVWTAEAYGSDATWVDDLESQKRGNRFTPPTTDDVRGHCIEKCYTFDPESFVAFYESKNWKVGNAKMKCWKSSCVTWQKREAKQNEGHKSAYQQRVEESDRSTFDLNKDFQ